MPVSRLALLLLTCLLAGCHVGGSPSPPLPSQSSATSLGLLAPDQRNEPTSFVQPASFVEAADEPLPEPVAVAPLDETATPLTLEQLEQMALTANPSIAEARARVEATRGKWLQVGLPPNTLVGYSAQQLGSGGTAEQQGLFVGQEFVRGNKLQLNRAVAAQEVQQTEQLLAVQQQRVITDVRLAFYDVLVAQRRSALAKELVTIAQQAIQTAEALLRAMEVSQVDVMRARIELQSAQLAQKNAENLHEAAWSRLTAVLGHESLPRRDLTGDLERTLEAINPDEVIARLVSESPEMAAALTDVERARWAVNRAHAEPIPNIDVQAVVQSDNGTGSSNANLQVSMPIPWLNRNQGGIRQAHAEVVAAERAVDRLEFSFKQRLATVYQRYANARNQVVDYSKEGGILANSRTTLDFVRRAYQAGELNYLDLITAQRTFSQTNLAYIESLGELWAAIVEIDGMLLKGSLEGR